MSIRLVTFDLDDTLWDNGGVIARADQEMRKWISQRVPSYQHMSFPEIRDLQTAVRRDHPEILHDVTKMRTAILRRAFERCGLNPSEALGLASGAMKVFMEWRNKVVLFDGARELVQRLGTRYVVASLTNGNVDVEQTPLRSCFNFSLSAADVGAQKPDPAMFLAALDEARVSAASAVHVGDHPEHDISAAAAVGMHTVWVNLTGSSERVAASRSVTGLAQLEKSIAGLSSD